jgi:hypothetical protein
MVDPQGDPAADQGVEEAVGREAGVRGLEDHHQDRGNRGLVHEQPPLPDEHGRRHSGCDHHRYLRRSDPDGEHDKVGDREPDDDPQRHLEGAPAAFAGR